MASSFAGDETYSHTGGNGTDIGQTAFASSRAVPAARTDQFRANRIVRSTLL
jgi:hypothetical protein